MDSDESFVFWSFSFAGRRRLYLCCFRLIFLLLLMAKHFERWNKPRIYYNRMWLTRFALVVTARARFQRVAPDVFLAISVCACVYERERETGFLSSPIFFFFVMWFLSVNARFKANTNHNYFFFFFFIYWVFREINIMWTATNDVYPQRLYVVRRFEKIFSFINFLFFFSLSIYVCNSIA